MKKLKQNSHEFLNILFAGIPENRRCSYEKVLFLGKLSDLDGEDDVLVSPNTFKNHEGLTLKSFVANVVPSVIIKKENVSDLPVKDFDKIQGVLAARGNWEKKKTVSSKIRKFQG